MLSPHATRPFATRTRTPSPPSPAQPPEPTLSYFDQSRHPRGRQDVDLAAHVLRQLRLPAELVILVLEAAEYWPLARFRRALAENVCEHPGGHVYMISPELGHDWLYDPGGTDDEDVKAVDAVPGDADTVAASVDSANVRAGCIRQIAFTIIAHEDRTGGSWSGGLDVWLKGIPTWFEAHVLKKGVEDEDNLTRPLWKRSVHLADNVRGYRGVLARRVVISCDDDDPVSAGMVRSLRRGDQIVVTAHAIVQEGLYTYINAVKEVEIEVYHSFVR